MSAAASPPPRLAILGVASVLPPSRPTREVAAELGADASGYRGWDNICLAGPDDHPSSMSTRALALALARSDVAADDLRLVLFTGMSRDYLPSWSVATEVMNECGTSPDCVGIDITIGCLSVLTGLNMALGWLMLAGGGHAAIVTAERWAYTVDRSRVELMSLWGHADGGGALVVGVDVSQPSLADYVGAEVTSDADHNGRVLIKHGGTRHPLTPPGEAPHQRLVEAGSAKQAKARYLAGYTKVASAIRTRFDAVPGHLVCNQISTAYAFGAGLLLPPER